MAKINSERSLDGKVAYVAGGTRGFNLAIARRYVEAGAAVGVMSRNQERVDKAVEALSRDGGRAVGFAIDVRDYDAVEASFKSTAAELGSLDIVVAGQAGNFYAPALGMSSNGFRTIIDIDLIGTFNVFRSCFEYLNKPGASLIAITAPEAVRPLPMQSHVCSAKAAVNMLCRCLALEWGPAGVRVNGISPGPIEGSWGMDNVIAADPAVKEKITRAIPLKRWGRDEDITEAALYLASSTASYITGTILDVDGGVTIASPGGDEVDAVFDIKRDPRVRQ